MKYFEYKEKVEKLLKENDKLWKQTHIMFIPISFRMMKEIPIGREIRVRYDIKEVWEEFVYKENKVIFFIKKHLECMINSLEYYEQNIKEDISFPIDENMEQAFYYFDSFIAFFSTLLEGEQREILYKYLNKNKIDDFFPTRKEIGLFWEIYMLRNRIIHFTKGRYNDDKAECVRFQDFSSKAKMIIIDSNENIRIESTLIDINKSNYIQEIIKKCINDKKNNPFELLFPNTSAKGYGKNKPFLSVITNDIWFDYIFSGVSLIERIQTVLDNINNLFFEKILSGFDDITNILSTKTCVFREKEKIEYSVQDVFDCDVKL